LPKQLRLAVWTGPTDAYDTASRADYDEALTEKIQQVCKVGKTRTETLPLALPLLSLFALQLSSPPAGTQEMLFASAQFALTDYYEVYQD